MPRWWRRPPPEFAYTRWDGTQSGFEFGADDVLSEITDDLLYHGDLNAALRRMLQSGFRDTNGDVGLFAAYPKPSAWRSRISS